MEKHKRWSPGTLMAQAYRDIANEHNATVDALESARKEIADWKAGRYRAVVAGPEHAGVVQGVVVPPIRVPFSDVQINAMAKACRNKFECDDRWEQSAYQEEWKDAIRAALAAGGLEPCALPEYKPEDVALRPERASDEELDALAQNAWKTDSGKHAAVRAVRARVEAPLLAEIQEHRRHLGIVMSREAELKARVAELEALYGLETAIALKTERDTLRAEVQRLEIECQDRAFYVTEFAAVSKERDAMKARVAALEHERDVVIIERDSEERHAERYLEEQKALRAELEAAQAECKHLNAIICERQPVDADAWKRALRADDWCDSDDYLSVLSEGDACRLLIHQPEDQAGIHLSPADAARAALWLASYAAAHGCPVGLPAHETRPVKVRWDVTPEEMSREVFGAIEGMTLGCVMRLMDLLAAHAVIDVPVGVPSSYELDRIGKAAVESWNPTDEKPKMERYATAIRNAVLASHPVPHEPPAAEVEALARVLRDAHAKALDFNPEAFLMDAFLDQARAAFAHIPSRSNAEMQICINRKNARIDALKACVKKWKAKATAVAPIASAKTLEKLAEIGRQAWHKSNGSVDYFDLPIDEADIAQTAAILRAAKARVDVIASDDGPPFYSPAQIDWLNSRIVYGVQLAEEKARVADAAFSLIDKIRSMLALKQGDGLVEAIQALINRAGTAPLKENEPAATHTGPTRAEAEAKWKELHNRDFTSLHNAQDYLDWLLPQLPDERAEMPSARDLVLMIRESANKANCPYSSIHGAADLIAPELLTALHPWLRAPTGWELDVTAEEFAEWLGCDTVAAKSVLSDLRSRIRPTFGPCKECALLRSRLEQSERMSDKRHEISHRYHQDIKKAHAVLSAALEGE